MSKLKAKKRIKIHPEEAEIVRKIYDLYLSGEGAKNIVEILNREGQFCRGKPWAKNRVIGIIGDEAYAGRYYFNVKNGKTGEIKPKEDWVLIPVEPIIDEITWEKAKKLKAERYPQSYEGNPAVTGSKTLLTGLANCGLCGGRMTMETAKGGRYVYYNCRNFIRKGKTTCSGQRITAETLEDAVLDHMANALFTKEKVKSILHEVFKIIKSSKKDNEKQRSTIQRQMNGIQQKLTKQYEAIESGLIDLAIVAERIKELKGQKEMLEAKLAEIKTSPAIPLNLYTDHSIERFQLIIRDLFLGKQDRTLTKRYLKIFIKEIVVNLPSIEIIGKTEAVIAVMKNKTAARTDVVLAADDVWLPLVGSNHRQSD
jgi:hypothetical protein